MKAALVLELTGKEGTQRFPTFDLELGRDHTGVRCVELVSQTVCVTLGLKLDVAMMQAWAAD